MSRARVQQKAANFDASYHAAIDALLAEFLPALEFAILPEALASPEVGLQKTLDLGAAEVVTGEFIAERAREALVFDQVSIGPVSLRPPSDLRDPSGLIERGMARLRPYLRPEVAPSAPTVRTYRPEAGR